MELVLIALIAIVAVLGYAFPPKRMTRTKKCHKQPHLDCPYRATYTPDGGIKYSGHGGCCKVIETYKKLNEAFCNMKPGIDSHNGITITEHVHQQALRDREYYKSLDDSGPLGYNKKEPTNDD